MNTDTAGSNNNFNLENFNMENFNLENMINNNNLM